MQLIASCKCGNRLKIPAGRTKPVRCPQCGGSVEVPAQGAQNSNSTPKRLPPRPGKPTGQVTEIPIVEPTKTPDDEPVVAPPPVVAEPETSESIHESDSSIENEPALTMVAKAGEFDEDDWEDEDEHDEDEHDEDGERAEADEDQDDYEDDEEESDGDEVFDEDNIDETMETGPAASNIVEPDDEPDDGPAESAKPQPAAATSPSKQALLWISAGIGVFAALIAVAAAVYVLVLRPEVLLVAENDKSNANGAAVAGTDNNPAAADSSAAPGANSAASNTGSRVNPTGSNAGDRAAADGDPTSENDSGSSGSRNSANPGDKPTPDRAPSTFDILQGIAEDTLGGPDDDAAKGEDATSTDSDDPASTGADPDASGTNADEPDDKPDPYASMALDVAAQRRAVAAILAIMKHEDNNMGFVFPLIHQRKVVEWKDVEVRYTRKTVTVPIWKDLYKPVDVLVPKKSGSVTIMRKETRKQLFKRIKVGERQAEHLVRDNAGDIIRIERRPVYGDGGPDIQKIGWYGNNAMALYALLDAGLTPDDEPALARLAESIKSYITVYGVPDYTWDIAWCVAAYAKYPGNEYEFTLNRLVSRLLAGQCTAKKQRGTWGPLCVSADHLALVLTEFSQVETLAEKLEAFAEQQKVKQDDPRLEERRAAIERAREEIAEQFQLVSRTANRFVDVKKNRIIEDPYLLLGPGLHVDGWPYSLYQETMADLQSTALAAFALRVTHEEGKLQPQYKFEHLRSVRGTPLVQRPIKTETLLEQTLKTLSAAEDTAGQWNEMIHWEETQEFLRLQDRFKGPPVTIPTTVESKKTPISNAYAVAAIEDLLKILGDDQGPQFSQQAAAARQALGSNIEAALEEPELPKDIAARIEFCRAFMPVAGGILEPFDYFYQLRIDPQTLSADTPRGKAYGVLIDYLTSKQGQDGFWDAPTNRWNYHCVSPAVRELARHRLKVLIDTWQAQGIKRHASHNDRYVFMHYILHYQWWLMSRDEIKRLATVYGILTLNRSAGTLLAVGSGDSESP